MVCKAVQGSLPFVVAVGHTLSTQWKGNYCSLPIHYRGTYVNNSLYFMAKMYPSLCLHHECKDTNNAVPLTSTHFPVRVCLEIYQKLFRVQMNHLQMGKAWTTAEGFLPGTEHIGGMDSSMCFQKCYDVGEKIAPCLKRVLYAYPSVTYWHMWKNGAELWPFHCLSVPCTLWTLALLAKLARTGLVLYWL